MGCPAGRPNPAILWNRRAMASVSGVRPLRWLVGPSVARSQTDALPNVYSKCFWRAA